MPDIFQDKHLTIFEDDEENVFVDLEKPGFNIDDLDSILEENPRVSIDDFKAFKQERDEIEEKKRAIPVGHLKPQIEILISQDKMMAFIKLNMTHEELEENENIEDDIRSTLSENGIVHGIKDDIISGPLNTIISILVAEGIRPINGHDSQIVYRELGDKKPTIRQDGSVDYYDMNFIHPIKSGEWVGEKRPYTPGLPGVDVLGQQIPCSHGKDVRLAYDRLSIQKLEEDGKTVLRAKYEGALRVVDDKVSIVKHLVIDGDVGYETGNIDFDGSVSIYGTVNDNFSVVATYDISINDVMGVGAAEKIVSKKGSIYIRGGVSGKHRTHVRAAHEIFVKYANSTILESADSINIGFYSLDSNLTSRRIILSFPKSRIIGGVVNAEMQVIAGSIGSPNERKTIINVKGFDKMKIKKQLQAVIEKKNQMLKKIEENARDLKHLENTISEIEDFEDYEKYKHVMTMHQKLLEIIDLIEIEKQYLLQCLKSNHEGEVKILKTAYPKTSIGIKKNRTNLSEEMSGTFYSKDNNMYVGNK